MAWRFILTRLELTQRRGFNFIVSFALCFLVTPAGNADMGIATNEAILSLHEAGFSESSLISVVRFGPSAFDVTPEGITTLKASGLPEEVIREMLNTAHSKSIDKSGNSPEEEKPKCFYGTGIYSQGSCLGGQRCYGGEWLPWDRCQTMSGGDSGGGGSRLNDFCNDCACCYEQ